MSALTFVMRRADPLDHRSPVAGLLG